MIRDVSHSERVAISPGARLGAYEILSKLRSGGMATLYLARRHGAAGFARIVAIKVVHPHLADDSRFVQMFLDEARVSSRIVHPNVVRVEELGEISDTFFLAMEYVHGCSLAELLESLSERGRWLRPELAVWIAAEVAAALHAAHEATDEVGQPLNIVHRDVSPQNILVGADGYVKLIDFGVAKARTRLTETRTGSVKGKLKYMAPEQLSPGMIDRRADTYSLGIVLWELLARRRRFSGDDIECLDEIRAAVHPPPSRYSPNVSPALEDALLRTLASDADERPPTALAFREQLLRVVPEARAIEPKDLAALVQAVHGDVLERRRVQLGEATSGIDLTVNASTVILGTADLERALVVQTVSASTMLEGLQASADAATRTPLVRAKKRPPAPRLPILLASAGLLAMGLAVLIAAVAFAGGAFTRSPSAKIDAPPPLARTALPEPHMIEPPQTVELPRVEIGATETIEVEEPVVRTPRMVRGPVRAPRDEEPAMTERVRPGLNVWNEEF
jgi:serine/threonine protein kinase